MTYNGSRAAAGRLSVAVLGTGLIGIDLVAKTLRSSRLDLGLVVGRDAAAPGLRRTAAQGWYACSATTAATG